MDVIEHPGDEHAGYRLLRYVCERCTLYYDERWSADAMPHPWLGLCPRCDAFNKPTVAAPDG
jgi:hypothetical protein